MPMCFCGLPRFGLSACFAWSGVSSPADTRRSISSILSIAPHANGESSLVVIPRRDHVRLIRLAGLFRSLQIIPLPVYTPGGFRVSTGLSGGRFFEGIEVIGPALHHQLSFVEKLSPVIGTTQWILYGMA